MEKYEYCDSGARPANYLDFTAPSEGCATLGDEGAKFIKLSSIGQSMDEKDNWNYEEKG